MVKKCCQCRIIEGLRLKGTLTIILLQRSGQGCHPLDHMVYCICAQMQMNHWCDISAVAATGVERRIVQAAVGKVNSMLARPNTSIPHSITFMSCSGSKYFVVFVSSDNHYIQHTGLWIPVSIVPISLQIRGYCLPISCTSPKIWEPAMTQASSQGDHSGQEKQHVPGSWIPTTSLA